MELYPRVKVDYAPTKTPYDGVRFPNLWTAIAAPLEPAPLPGELVDEVEGYPQASYTGRAAGFLYKQASLWRVRLNHQFQRVKFREGIVNLSHRIFEPALLRDAIAIFHRAEKGLDREQLNSVMPTYDQMVSRVNDIDSSAPVIVCTDSEEGLEGFTSRLGDRAHFWTGIDRTPKAGDANHFKNAYGVPHVEQVFAQALAISRAKHFVHITSNIATFVLYANPWMPSSFVHC